MSISITPGLNHLATFETKVKKLGQAFENVYEHQKIIQKLETHLQNEFKNQVATFNWESDKEKRALLDQLYDHQLIADWTERQYAFTRPDETLLFMQKIKSALEKKSQEVQESYQLYNSEKEELMQFYNALIEIITKLANIGSSLAQRV